MKSICLVLAMVLLAGRHDLDAQTPEARGAQPSLDVVDADALARIRKALQTAHSDQRLTAVPAQYLHAQSTLRNHNGTVVDEVAWGAAVGALVPALSLAFACYNTTEPKPAGCNQATMVKYVSVGAGIGALAGLVVGIFTER